MLVLNDAQTKVLDIFGRRAEEAFKKRFGSIIDRVKDLHPTLNVELSSSIRQQVVTPLLDLDTKVLINATHIPSS